MRILLLSRVFPPRVGGIENYVHNIYTRLATRYNHQIVVVTPTNEQGRSDDFDARQPFRVVRTPRLPVKPLRERYNTPLLGMTLAAREEVKLFRPDQIHCDQVFAAYLGRALAEQTRRPYLTYAYHAELTERKKTSLKRWAFANAATVVAISTDTQRLMHESFGLPLSRLPIVRPGADLERFQLGIDGSTIRARHNLEGKRVILTTGRMPVGGRQKGQDTVIGLMPQILERVPEAVYLIVGDGPDRPRLEGLVRDLGLQEKVIFAGRVAEDDLPRYYAASDVFIMLSRPGRTATGGTQGEGFGIVYVEANACGKPTIGIDDGGVADAIAHGVSGFLVPREKPELAVNALATLLRNPELAERMGLAGRKRAEEEFSWDVTARQMHELIENLGATQ